MNRVLFSMAAVLCLSGSIAAAQPVKQKVAVYVTGDAETGYKKVIGSKLVTGITRSENYAAVERTADFLAELTKEQDYQLSGAVSDNQIARLGQQFGVRYVLVADISEVFESMFISARMIDVQTAQITKSTEASGAVSNIESLTKLAEDIVLVIMTTPKFTGDTVKLLQSCSSFSELQKCKAPEGYHIATKEEISDIIKEYQITGKELSFPIYTNIEATRKKKTQYFTYRMYYTYRERKVVDDSSTMHRPYDENIVSCILIDNSGNYSKLNLSYIDDSKYDSHYQFYNVKTSTGGGTETVGLTDMSTNPPHISPGYIYIVKDNDK